MKTKNSEMREGNCSLLPERATVQLEEMGIASSQRLCQIKRIPVKGAEDSDAGAIARSPVWNRALSEAMMVQGKTTSSMLLTA